MRKNVVFTLLALALPFLVIGLVEAGLRVAGVKAEVRTAFVPVAEHPEWRVFNPGYAARYFQGFRPSVAYHPFLREREADAFRVVVLGGSSAAGFPYHFYYGFPDRLAQRIQTVAAGRRVEVINLGMTAVNSYTLRDLSGAVADLRPDAVLVYAGHNEYYGAFGAGSTLYALARQRWLKRLVLSLKHSVLYLMLEDLWTPERPPSAGARTMMARVVRDAGIVRDGPVYRAGLDQFSENMEAVVGVFRKAGIPVYLGTLTSNLADQPPLGENPEALAAYREGQRLRMSGDTLAARAAFLKAKEYDPIRFRAPEAINDRIRALAERPGVTLVAVDELFRAHSPGGLEGNALFDDHLHPNARGYDLMAEAFFEALRPVVPVSEGTHDVGPPVLDPYEAAVVDLQLARLKGGYPFDKEVTPEEEERRFRVRLERRRRAGFTDSLAVASLVEGLTPPEALLAAVREPGVREDTLTTLRLYRSLLAWQPFNRRLKDEAVALAVTRDPPEAEVPELLRVAVRPTYALPYMNALAAIAIRRGRLAAAAGWLAAVERRDPGSEVMLYNMARLLVLRGDTLGARGYFERYRQGARGRD